MRFIIWDYFVIFSAFPFLYSKYSYPFLKKYSSPRMLVAASNTKSRLHGSGGLGPGFGFGSGFGLSVDGRTPETLQKMGGKHIFIDCFIID